MSDTVHAILRILRNRYPVVKTQLNHASPFQLLTAAILSAQCTDARVNQVTPDLFRVYPDCFSLAEASQEQVERLIFSTGFYRNKSRNIRACARAIVERHQGTVPSTLVELVALPGVGRKTANLLLSTLHGKQAIVVDTHVGRVSRRLGLTDRNDPTAVEFDLMRRIPQNDWNDFSLRLIHLGRDACTARKPLCPGCPLTSLCRKQGVSPPGKKAVP
jgi:endonuclease-3